MDRDWIELVKMATITLKTFENEFGNLLDIINKGINDLETEIDYLTNGQTILLAQGETLDEIENKVKLRKVCLKKLKGLKNFICDDPELLEDK